MPTQPHLFRQAYYDCDWIFDFFAHAFDFLNGRFFPPSGEVDDPQWAVEEEEIRRKHLLRIVTDHDGDIPDELRHYIQLPGGDTELEAKDFCLRLYCAMTLVDRAAADLNYLAAMSAPPPLRWENTSRHIQRNRQQLQRSATGLIAFRPRSFEMAGKVWRTNTLAKGPWIEIPERGESFANYFQNLLRVQTPDDCDVDIRLTSSAQDFEMDPTKLSLGIVPLIDTLKTNVSDAQLLPGSLRLVKETTSPATFGIQFDSPTDPHGSCTELCDRAEAALRYLATKGAQIVLFPEMVVPDSVLNRLKDVLFELDRSGQPCPGLTLAGSFTRIVTKHSVSTPFNVAVGLNGKGQELWRQRKLQPYDMKLYEQQRFGLDKILESKSCRENIEFVPRLLRFVDSRQTGLRIATLICEDATRAPGLRIAQELCANLVLVPVMAGPLTHECGFATNLDGIVQSHDAVFVVANSGALARAAWKGAKPGPPLVIVGIPLVLPTKGHKTHELLDEPQDVPGHKDLQVFYYQLPSA